MKNIKTDIKSVQKILDELSIAIRLSKILFEGHKQNIVRAIKNIDANNFEKAYADTRILVLKNLLNVIINTAYDRQDEKVMSLYKELQAVKEEIERKQSFLEAVQRVTIEAQTQK